MQRKKHRKDRGVRSALILGGLFLHIEEIMHANHDIIFINRGKKGVQGGMRRKTVTHLNDGWDEFFTLSPFSLSFPSLTSTLFLAICIFVPGLLSIRPRLFSL